MTIALIALATSAGTQTAQVPKVVEKNFFYQNGNGKTRETKITYILDDPQDPTIPILYFGVNNYVNRATTTTIILPKTWKGVQHIYAEGITNLTRIVLEFEQTDPITIFVEGTKMDEGELVHPVGMLVKVESNGYLGPVPRKRVTPKNLIIREFEEGRTETLFTEISWEQGILQISKDMEKWEDVPIWINTLPDRSDLEFRRILRWP